MDSKRFLIFYQSFNRIVQDIKKLEMSYMSEYGLRSVHMGCLLHIKQNEKGMTVTQLAKASKTDKALISRAVKELIADGFITTRSSAENKTYNKRYFLTEKSEKIVSNINEDVSEYMSRARADIPEEDMTKFYEVLALLENNISLIAKD